SFSPSCSTACSRRWGCSSAWSVATRLPSAAGPGRIVPGRRSPRPRTSAATSANRDLRVDAMSEETKSAFEKAAEQGRPAQLSDFWFFLRHNQKWWLIPLVVVLLLFSLLLLLPGSAAAPFIYTLF